jgi:hypothetical protein
MEDFQLVDPVVVEAEYIPPPSTEEKA